MLSLDRLLSYTTYAAVLKIVIRIGMAVMFQWVNGKWQLLLVTCANQDLFLPKFVTSVDWDVLPPADDCLIGEGDTSNGSIFT